jgi:hypothetical protein
VLVDRTVQVEGPSDKLLTVYRGIERETYSCTPTCQRRITLGDAPTYFNATIGQSGTMTKEAAGSSAGDGQSAAPR